MRGWSRARVIESPRGRAKRCRRVEGRLYPPRTARPPPDRAQLGQGHHRVDAGGLTKSFSSAADTASRYPPNVQDQNIAGAKTAFLQGDQWTYLAGIIAALLGATVVFLKFPKMEREQELLAEYHAKDVGVAAEPVEADAEPHQQLRPSESSRGSVPSPNWAVQSASFW
jgi:hypothetical protein